MDLSVIEIVFVRCTMSRELQAHLAARLRGAERRRAERFRREDDRARFVVGRALLREVLARRLGRSREDVELAVLPTGRPILAGGGAAFSLAHSGDVVGVAAADEEIGLDIEAIVDRDTGPVARALFTAAERAWIAAAPDPRRAFAEVWTARETVLKARGLGLAGMPDGFALPPPSARPVRIGGSRVALLDAGPGYAAAVCAAGEAPIPRPSWIGTEDLR